MTYAAMRIAFLTTDNREQHSRYDVSEPYFGTAMQALLDGFAMLPSEIEVHVISCTRRRMKAPEKLAENIWFHQPVVPKIAWGRMAFTGCGLAVRRILSRIRPDVVHAQGTERDCAVSMMMSGFPGILTIHGHMARIAELTGAGFPSFYWMARRLEEMAIKRANGVVCITNYTERRVSESARRTWVIPNAVDSAFFQIKSPAKGNKLLCVAHVCAWKRQVELIEALDELPVEKRPELVFLGDATGQDPYSLRFHQLIADRDWCRHAGNVGRAELRNWLAEAAALVLPSIEDNCPMVILEAMAAGVPVVAAAIGGVPDLVRHEETGLLFDPQKPEEIREAVSRVMGNTETRSEFSRVAYQKSLRRFHPKVVAQEHLKIYQNLITNWCPPS